MAIPTSTILRLAAAGTLAGGVSLALGISRTPVGAVSHDTTQLRELAARVEAQQVQTGAFAPLDVPAGPVPVPQVIKPIQRSSPAPRLELKPPVLPKPHGTPAVTLARPAPPQPAAPPPAPRPAAPEDPAKNVALLGITHLNGEDSAWLVDLRDQDREIVEVGEQAFGFTLKEIEEDHVVLARGGDEITLHLGEKRIVSNTSAGPGSASAAIEPLGGTGGTETGEGRGRGRGFGRGGFGGAGMGGFGGFGGRGFSSFGGSSGGGFGGRSRSGRSGGYAASASSSTGGGSFGGSSGSGYNSSRSAGGRSSFGGGSSTGSFGRMSGSGRSSGFGGAGFAGGGGQNGGGASQFSSTSAVTSTSNPQTARRRGARLSGDAAPIDLPDPVSNPQTTRRLGTANSGAAFGQDGGTAGSQRNRR